MRREVIATLRSLSNADRQQRVWVRAPSDADPYDEFDFAVHVLFDDTPIADRPEAALGTVLRDSTEVALLQRVVAAINEVLREVGTAVSDAEYLASRRWPRVVSTAAEALDQLLEPDPQGTPRLNTEET